MEFVQLHSGLKIPQLGFGTADIGSQDKTKEVILMALDAGFTRFDTASMYGNEEAIGEVIREQGNRSQLTITTKLWDGGNFSYENTIGECKNSLSRLGLDYIDIYLHHWPVTGQRLESWQALEYLKEKGSVASIGVSNYTISHLQELMDTCSIQPDINQVEFNPFLNQTDLLEYCRKNDILLEAYSPFSKGRRLQNPILHQIAAGHNKSTAQVILRWAIQLGISVIPKASSKEHIMENLDIFDFVLSKEEMARINQLNENYRIEWDPSNVE